jgi:hypothetical protein
METEKKIFNSSSCFVDLLYAKKYIDELKQKDKIKIDENDVKMLANNSKPYWLSMQNQCTVISFDGHNIVSAYFPGFTVKCGNCFMGKCEVIKIPYRPSTTNKNNAVLITLLGSVQ